MIAYKGFNKDLTCRGFQYEIGKTYEEPKAVLCECGFHACKEVLDVFSYYPPNESRYCVVDIDDISEIKIGDSKICGAKITILREITIDEICRIAYDQNAENQSIKSENSGDWSVASNSGSRSVASNSGSRSVASNSGNWSVASNSGNRSVASNSGVCSVASNSGVCSVASNSGNWSVASNSGSRSVASNSGDWSVASNSGSRSVASNSGDWSVASNSGDCSVASNSGDCSVASNSGDCSVASNSGNRSVASNSGVCSVASNSGNRSVAITLLSESKSQVSNNSVAISLGRNGLASGDIGCFIVLAETINEKIVDVKAAKVDGQNIKANVLYKLENGKFVES